MHLSWVKVVKKLPSRCYPWMRVNNIIICETHHVRLLHAAIGILVTLFIGVPLVYSLVRLQYYYADHTDVLQIGRQNVSSQRILPFIPTERSHVQHGTYEDIVGRFELYDKLDLSTTTGVIDIEIDLQPGNGTAELVLSSSTGPITLGISESWWLRGKERTLRPIRTSIKTVTGNILGWILLGQGGHACIDSVTGKQGLRIYVYDASPDDKISELITRSHVGDQVVALTHFGAWDSTITSLKAEHRNLGTANVDSQYSRSWRGEVHAVSSAVGKLEVQGDVD